jgi:hypothetical protein
MLIGLGFHGRLWKMGDPRLWAALAYPGSNLT